MTPESFQFSLRINHQSLRIYLIVNAKAPEQAIDFTTNINNMPDFRIDKHRMLLILLLPSPFKIIVKIIIIVLPIGTDLLAADGAAASFPLDVVPEQR